MGSIARVGASIFCDCARHDELVIHELNVVENSIGTIRDGKDCGTGATRLKVAIAKINNTIALESYT